MAGSIAVRRVLASLLQWGPLPLNLGLDDATVKHVKEKENYTNFDSLGFRESATCVTALECSAKGMWDARVNYVDATHIGNPAFPNMYPQDNGGPAKIYVSANDPTFWYIPVVTIPSATVDLTMAQKLAKYACDFESNGPFITPSGQFGFITG